MKNLLPAILTAASLSAAAAESPADFAFAVPIEGLGADALHRVAIPQAVYESAAFSDLRDLRVFNGAGEVVPYAFRPVDRISEKPAPVTLPIFPLQGPRDARSDELDLSFDKSRRQGQRQAEFTRGDGRAAGAAWLSDRRFVTEDAAERHRSGLGKGDRRPLGLGAARSGRRPQTLDDVGRGCAAGRVVARGTASATQGDRV